MDAGTVQAQIIAWSDLSPEDRRSWDDLAARALEANVFFEPAALDSALRNLAVSGPTVVAVARRQNHWLACLPLVELRSWRKLPLRVLVNRPVREAEPHPVGLGTPLVDRTEPDAGIDALFDLLIDRRRRADASVLVLEWTSLDGPVHARAEEALSRRRRRPLVYETWERPAVRRRPEGGYLEGGLSARHRRELNRRRRRLGEAVGGTLKLVDRSQDPSAVDDLLRLESSGWKGRMGSARSDLPGIEAFFRELCDICRNADRLWFPSLEVDGRPIVMSCFLRSGDTLFARKTAYDEEVSRYSPGVHLDADVLEAFHGQGASLMDSCNAVGDTWTASTWPDRRRLGTVLVPLGGRVSASLVSQLPATRALSRRARAVLRRGEQAG